MFEKAFRKGNKAGFFRVCRVVLALIAAASLVTGLCACSKKEDSGKSGRHVLFTLLDGSAYLDDTKDELVPKCDDFRLASHLNAAVYERNEKLYYAKDGEQTRIGFSKAEILMYDRLDLSWVLYEDNDGSIFLFRPGKEDVEVLKEGELARSSASPNQRYVTVYSLTLNTLVRVDTNTGEVLRITSGKRISTFPTDNEGNVYYNVEGEPWLFDGKESQEADFSVLMILDGLLLCTAKASQTKGFSYCTREPGTTGKLYHLEDTIDPFILVHMNSAAVAPGGGSAGLGYRSSDQIATTGVMISVFDNQDTFLTRLNKALILHEGSIYMLDFEKREAELFLEDAVSLDEIYYSEDQNDAVVKQKDMLYYMSYGKDGWTGERITKHCDRLETVCPKGIVFLEDGAVCTFSGGQKTVLSEDCPFTRFCVSEDLKSMACLDDEKVMYISAPGAKPELLASRSDGQHVVIYEDWVYYISEDDELMRVRSGKEPEKLLEDVDYLELLTF